MTVTVKSLYQANLSTALYEIAKVIDALPECEVSFSLKFYQRGKEYTVSIMSVQESEGEKK